MGIISEDNTKEKAVYNGGDKETDAGKVINGRKADAFTALKERQYEKIVNKFHITEFAMNVFIAMAVIALIMVIIIGMMNN